MMTKRIMAIFIAAFWGCALCASEANDKKIEAIARIVRWEFNKVPSPGRKAQKYQIYKSLTDPKIKTSIYAEVGKKVKPFETKAKQVGISAQARKEVAQKMAKRFPYKTDSEIAMGAINEAENEYPLVKKGDDVTIRYTRNGVSSKISGKVQSVREGGRVYEVNNKLIRISDIREADRKFFDPDMNEMLRNKFREHYQTNYAKIKRDFNNYLLAEELEKVVENEKNGYIFFKGRWQTAKAVTDQLISYYLAIYKKRYEVESKHFVKGKLPAAPKQKK